MLQAGKFSAQRQRQTPRVRFDEAAQRKTSVAGDPVARDEAPTQDFPPINVRVEASLNRSR